MTGVENIKKILIVGKGGREHVLGWRIKKADKKRKLFFATGNAGTEKIGKNIDIDPEDVYGCLQFAKDNEIDLTIVGPEGPLALGIVDEFEKENQPIFGPTKMAAMLEIRKSWAIQFMDRHHIPHPATKIFYSTAEALSYLQSKDHPTDMVVKPDGLTGGHGVEVCLGYGYENLSAEKAVIKNLTALKYGVASRPTLIQEKLTGKEISVFAFSDGENILPFLTARDFKQLNLLDSRMTGGMGGYAPAEFDEKFLELILKPAILGMKAEGYPFKGMLYAGLMLTDDGPKVLEFNTRFGDPETQLQMRLLKSDPIEPILACINGNLDEISLEFRSDWAVGFVLATEGYPEKPIVGDEIFGLNKNLGSRVIAFHGATSLDEGKYKTAGGRPIMVTAIGRSPQSARLNLLEVIGKNGIHFRGMQFRRDIGS